MDYNIDIASLFQFSIYVVTFLQGVCFLVWRSRMSRVSQFMALETAANAMAVYGALLVGWALQGVFSWSQSDILNENTLLRGAYSLSRIGFVLVLTSETFMALLQLKYPLVKRTLYALAIWLVVSLLLTYSMHRLSEEAGWGVLTGVSVLFIIYVVIAVNRFTLLYHKTLKVAENFFSYDVEQFVRWLKLLAHILSVLGVTVAIHILMPHYDGFTVLYVGVLGTILFAFSLSFVKFMMLITTHIGDLQINHDIEDVSMDDQAEGEELDELMTNPTYLAIAQSLELWEENHGFIDPQLTIVRLAKELDTNRTYLSPYINTTYGTTFRDWISSLRLEYAKELLLENPELPAYKIGMMVGYSSNRFVVVFTQKFGLSPGQWRKQSAK